MLLLLGCTGSSEDPHTPCVDDVERSFASIDASGTALSIGDGTVFEAGNAWRYTLTVDNEFGLDNHLQGLARMGPFLFISGGDAQRTQADVFVGELGGQMLGRVPLDEGDEWHAGGIDLLDGVLAVPTERLRVEGDEHTASLRLFDVTDPLASVPLDVIDLGTNATAHAVGMTRVGDQVLLASWDDRQLDLFWRGDTTPFGVIEAANMVSEVPDAGTPGVNGQSVNLLQQCDGQVYAVLADNTSDLPIDGGTDFAELFLLDVDQLTLTKVASKALVCPPDQGCNFRAAGGVWVDEDAQVRLYSTPYYRDGEAGLTRVGEFAPTAR